MNTERWQGVLALALLGLLVSLIVVGALGRWKHSEAQTTSKPVDISAGWAGTVQARELTMSECKYLVVCGNNGSGIDVEVLHEPNCPNHGAP